MVPSRLPLASVCPSGLNATESTATVPPLARGWPSALGCAGSPTSHNATVPSRLPLASVCPSGLNATESTAAAPPLARGWPSALGCAGSATSHNATVPSASPLASVCPSELNATEFTATVALVRGWAGRAAGVRGIGDIPQPDGAVVVAAGQRLPIRAERHRVHSGGTARWPWAGRAGGGARDRRHPTAG